MSFINKDRLEFYNKGLEQLPADFVTEHSAKQGKNGETLIYDEAEVWKRVLNYRIAKHLKPTQIIETHGGKGLSTDLYRLASPESKIISCQNYENELSEINDISFADIDPFGRCWDCLDFLIPRLADKFILSVTNGEMLSVCRNLKNIKYPTSHYGKEAYKWTEREFIPQLEELTSAHAVFYYMFPTTCRVILAKGIELPENLFDGCKRRMWWL